MSRFSLRTAARERMHDAPWILSRDEIRRRVAKILAENPAWTYRALADAASVNHKKLGHMVLDQEYIGPNQQVRLSRMIHLVETGRLVPVKIRQPTGGRPIVAAEVREVPLQVKTQMAVGVGRFGPKLRMSQVRDYSWQELHSVRQVNGRPRKPE